MLKENETRPNDQFFVILVLDGVSKLTSFKADSVSKLTPFQS